jgi:RHS repeat-associated protein
MNNHLPQRIATSRVALMVALLLIVSVSAMAQDQSQYDHGTPPQHATGISTIGSYLSTELGTINLSNGSLNFKLPLGTVGGRGFSMPLTLNYSNKVWSATRSTAFDPDAPGGGQNYPVAVALYDDPNAALDIYQRVAPGWSIGSVPVLRVRGMGIDTVNIANGCGANYMSVLVKLTLILPDKGEIELRDDVTDGSPLGALADQWGCRDMDGYRGQRWHATDGSGAVFISDVDNGVINGDLNGTVITGDGTRYRIQDPGNYFFGGSAYLQKFGRAISVTDRNGNILNVNYPGGSSVQYTDQLGRTTTRIDFGAPDPDSPNQTLAVLVTLPGYNGQNHYYKIKTDTMNQHYRAGINPTLPVINGDNDPLGYGYSYPGPHTSLFPLSYGSSRENIDTQAVLTQLVLPDGRSLTFNYNEYGEVAEVVMPTGGKVQYDYAYTSALPAGNSASWETQTVHIPSDVREIDRAVAAKRTYANGSTVESSWSYAYGPQAAPNGTYDCTEVQAHAADNSLLLSQRHFFMAKGRFLSLSTNNQVVGTGYSLWSTGIEWRTETRNATPAVLGASEEDWSQRASIAWSYYPSEQIANDNRINETRRYLDTGTFAKADTFYDNANYPRANNVSEVKEYDYDQSLKRRTTSSYVTGSYQTDDSIHLLSLPLQQSVYASDGTTEVARTVNEYDVYAHDGNHEYLQDYAPITVTGHDSSYGTGKLTRGNPTALGHWLNTNNTTIYSYPRYDTLGNVVATKDANGNVTSLSYTDDFGDGSNPGGGVSGTNGATYALPTLITSPPPTPGAPVQTARSQYDFSTGLLTGFRDRNNIVSQTIYKDPSTNVTDPFDRPRVIKAALGISGVESHTAVYYAQSTPITIFGVTLTNNDVLTAMDQTNLDDATLRSWKHTDGFGRTVETWSRDPQGDDKVATIYDALGRVKQQSNPFRPSLGETAIYTTTAYDLAGRVISVTTPDSALVTTSYNGNTVTVTDQAGKARKSVTDALGRLSQVYEDPNGVNYLTSYAYDALDNLATVTQDTQPSRSFIYNSLKRLTSGTNPESGTINYTYDNNGNLTQKTDARPVTTNYVYDALNRPTSRTYSDGTPAVTYTYDSTSVANGKGRLASVNSSVSTYSYSAYDALGRVSGGAQTLGSQSYSLSYAYDLAGHVKSMTYPSLHNVTYNYDVAGRLADKDAQNLAFTGNLGDFVARTYATGVSYDAGSRMTQEQFGTNPAAVYNKLFYNSRGQLAEIRDSTTGGDTSWNRGAIINHYSDQCWGMCGGSNSTQSMTDNNGNLKNQDIYIPNNDQVSSYVTWRDHFDYDSLNRLQRVREYADGTHDWQQEYVYDRWGNRTINQANTWGGVNNQLFSVDPNTNRLTVPSGYSGTMAYDSAGNLTNDTYSGQGQRTYDAENRMTQAWANGQWQVYSYDGDGRRARRKVNGVETWQVYGIGGELVAEYAPNAPATTPDKEYGYRNGQLLVTASAVDLALGKTATQSSTFYIMYASLAVDGNTNGDFWGGMTSATADYGYQDWWQVDLGSSQSIGKIQVWPRTDCCPEHTANFYVLVSDNPFTSTDLNTTLNQSGVSNYWVPGNNATTATVTVNRTGRYVRVQRNDSQYLVLAEVKVLASSADVNWLVTDQLGTPRIIFDKTGSLVNTKRHDYLPFGEELFANQGLRTGTMGYIVNDGIRQKFTQKERDNETGLDYFLARYYSSTQGRFTSVDPDNAEAAHDINDPQGWNGYAYVKNNPCNSTDPDGRCICLGQRIRNAWNGYGLSSDQQIQAFEDYWRNYLRKEQELNGTLVFVGDDGKSFIVDPNTISRNEVIHYAAELRDAEYYGRVKHYTQEQVDQIRGIQLPSAPQIPIALPTGSFNTVGQNLKNLRDIGSGRLKGFTRGNTELSGGNQAARETFKQLTGRDPAGSFDRVVQGTREVVYRASSGSGVSKIEIVDNAQKFLEKISFRP